MSVGEQDCAINTYIELIQFEYKTTARLKEEKNMKKKVVSSLLIMTMLTTVLAGCGSGSKDEGKKPQADSGETETIAIQLVNVVPELPDVEAVEAELNKITEKEINCKVDIQNLFIGDLPTTTSMNIVSDEKMDIVAVGLTQKLADIYDDGILMELDDYLEYAPNYVAAVENVLKAGQVNGVQYALPANPYVANSPGFVYNKDMADELGITIEKGADLDDLTRYFEAVKAKDVYGTSAGTSGALNVHMYYNVETFGTNADFGYIADPVNSTKVENFYASDIFKNYCAAAKAWNDTGYMPAGSLTDTTTPQEYFKMEKLFGLPTGYDMSQFATWQSGQSFAIDIAQLDDPIITTASTAERMWGIAANSKHPEKAMELLELIYTNADVANLLQYGIEGKHYTKVEGTENVCTAEGAEVGPEGYTSLFTKYGDPTKAMTAVPNGDDYLEKVEEFNKDVPTSKSLGYVFDVTNVSAEAGAVSNVIAEHLPRLQSGNVENVDAAIEEFVNALDKAGMSAIIEENQKQLDAYMEQQ